MMESVNTWFSISFWLSSRLFSLIQDVRCANTVATPAELAGTAWCLRGLSRRVKIKECGYFNLGHAKNQALQVHFFYQDVPQTVASIEFHCHLSEWILWLWQSTCKYGNVRDNVCRTGTSPSVLLSLHGETASESAALAGSRGAASLSVNGWLHWNVGLFPAPTFKLMSPALQPKHGTVKRVGRLTLSSQR